VVPDAFFSALYIEFLQYIYKRKKGVNIIEGIKKEKKKGKKKKRAALFFFLNN